MKIALLGGSGFIGKNLALELSAQHEVYIIDRIIDEEWFLRHGFAQSQLKIAELNQVNEVLQDLPIDKLIHLVSTIVPGSSMENPEQGYSEDVISTIKILEHIKDKKIDIVFFSSGGTVYGDKSDFEAIAEETPLHPISHYGVVKGTIESILLMYNRVYNMKNKIIRLANPYGEYQNMNGAVGAIAVFMNKIMHGEDIVITGDGNVVRDYIHIHDVRKFVGLLIEKEQTNFDIYNLGSGHGVSLNEIIRLLEKLLNKRAKVIYKEARKFDVARNVLDISRIKSEFQTDIAYGIEAGIEKYYQTVYLGKQ